MVGIFFYHSLSWFLNQFILSEQQGLGIFPSLFPSSLKIQTGAIVPSFLPERSKPLHFLFLFLSSSSHPLHFSPLLHLPCHPQRLSQSICVVSSNFLPGDFQTRTELDKAYNSSVCFCHPASSTGNAFPPRLYLFSTAHFVYCPVFPWSTLKKILKIHS